MAIRNCVVFGGSGFIGLHLTHFLLSQEHVERVWLADLRPPELEAFPQAVRDVASSAAVRYVPLDVRAPIAHPELPEQAELVVNLAAVHREPGHEPEEYFETNLAGAENVCRWAGQAGCRLLAFTSSIAAYGSSGRVRDEASVPVPETPYGASKLAAEKIHLGWQGAGAGRRLLIVRPGVVFGPGEHGNVTRLVRAVVHRYFVYTGNRGTRKAGGYVRELCGVLWWALERLQAGDEGVLLCNFTLDPPPTMEDFVQAISQVAGLKRAVPGVPHALLLLAAQALALALRPLGLRAPVDPTRVRKLVRSNNIEPGVLRASGYPYRYTLAEALADWRRERPEDWQ